MKKRYFALFMAVIMVITFMTSCAPKTPETPNETGGSATDPAGEKKDRLVVAVPDAPIHLDPHIQASIASYRVTTQIFDRLLSMDNELNFVPGLAESWEVLDDRTTQFNLRKDVTFHDGEHMTAEDVKFSLERCIASNGVNYNYLIISDIDIIDDYTITITTREPFNAMLYRLTLDAASIMSKKAVEAAGDDFNNHPVGAGPYRFVSWDLAGDVVLEAFPEYYKGESAVKTLVFRQIPEAINRGLGLETGEIDLAYDLEITDLANLEANKNLDIKTAVSTTVWYVGFNCSHPILANEKVRQAIAYAINPQDVIDIVFSGVADPAHNTMLVPRLFGSAAPSNEYEQDFEKAKALLADAGYADGFDIELWCSDSQVMRTMAEVLQDQLRQVGVVVKILPSEQGSYYEDTGNGKHEMFILSKTSIDPDSMMRAMYHTEALGPSGNRSFWTSPEVDAKLDEASTTTDQARAAELYKEVQEIVGTTLPLYPLAIEHLTAGMQNNVAGFDLYPGKSHYIYGTYFK